MLEPPEMAVLSFLPLLNTWFETGTPHFMHSYKIQDRLLYCYYSKKLYN